MAVFLLRNGGDPNYSLGGVASIFVKVIFQSWKNAKVGGFLPTHWGKI